MLKEKIEDCGWIVIHTDRKKKQNMKSSICFFLAQNCMKQKRNSNVVILRFEIEVDIVDYITGYIIYGIYTYIGLAIYIGSICFLEKNYKKQFFLLFFCISIYFNSRRYVPTSFWKWLRANGLLRPRGQICSFFDVFHHIGQYSGQYGGDFMS